LLKVSLVLQSDPNEPNGPDIDAKIDEIKNQLRRSEVMEVTFLKKFSVSYNTCLILRLPKSKLRPDWSAFMLVEVNRLNA
jgi:hypothetical protein